MAVEGRHLNLLHPQFFGNRELAMTKGNGCSCSGNACIDYGAPLAAGHAVLVKHAPLQSDSGVTYAAVAAPSPRKRQRRVSFADHLMTSAPPILNVQNHHAITLDRQGGSYTFLGEDISAYLLQQQSDIDRFVAQHNEIVGLEIHERRRRYLRGIAAAAEEIIVKKLKAREEEIDRIGKLNSLLEERVRSLSTENQIWRDVAQSNEAAADALRSNLEQVLAQVIQRDDQLQAQREHRKSLAAADGDDAQSCCGSSDHRRNDDEFASHSKDRNPRICRSCGREESCVQILPCRHLCVCAACSTSAHACPVCRSTKTPSLHANLSSS